MEFLEPVEARARRYSAHPDQLIDEQLWPTDEGPYGTVGEPWQLEFFRAVFARQADGRPMHRLCYDERRRGESKTADTAAVAVADLLTGPRRHRTYAIAGDEDQASLIVDSVLDLKARSPILRGLEVFRTVVRNPISDSELRVLSADDRTSYGIRPRLVIFDELSLQPDDRLWKSMWSSVGKSPQAQMVAVSMAGWDFTSIAWKVREMARSGAEEGRYYFHSREGSELAPWLSEEDVEEQRLTLHPADFARFWQARWTEAQGSWVTREMVEACETGVEQSHGLSGRRYCAFIDIGLVHDATAIAVCHSEPDAIVLDTLATLTGTRDNPVELSVLEDTTIDLVRRFGIKQLVIESPQGVASAQRLRDRLADRCRVTVQWPTAESQGRLFGTLYRLISTHRLRLFPHDQLKRELLQLHVRSAGGRLKVVDSQRDVHQDHVVALGGAALLLDERALLTAEQVQTLHDLNAAAEEGQHRYHGLGMAEGSLGQLTVNGRWPV